MIEPVRPVGWLHTTGRSHGRRMRTGPVGGATQCRNQARRVALPNCAEETLDNGISYPKLGK